VFGFFILKQVYPICERGDKIEIYGVNLRSLRRMKPQAYACGNLFKNMTEDNKTVELFPEEILKELVDAGVFYGRKKSRTHPKMKSYVLANRGGIEIVDLNKALEKFEDITKLIKEKAKGKGLILFVGTQPAAFQEIERIAKEFDYPYVINRWLGGTLTNHRIITKRIEYLKKLRSGLASGAFEKYTKKERSKLDSEMLKLEELLGGIEKLDKLPELVVIIDSNLHTTAVREAKRLKIPVIAFANVDCDPVPLDYFIVGNNKARKSVEWFLGKIEQAIKEGKAEAPAVLPADATKDAVPVKEK